MKSAYERAMERLEKESGPGRKLSDDERQRIADIDQKYDARAAETKLSYEQKIVTAAPPEVMGLKDEMNRELARIEDQRNASKDEVWNG